MIKKNKNMNIEFYTLYTFYTIHIIRVTYKTLYTRILTTLINILQYIIRNINASHSN